ncbi:outer membrane protein assembly factor BamB family protein [Stratiformator vulcanicus]|uniref:Outer membrane biogenesis protein BamB n=1 Tax=Stratiformator vulcanicus TaxID=2527980 RepID=A0A517R5Z3_9PLAN|nr:PQQ-binding-like beta-propeller repeat protein [Stratiformator vulcanicus]QDT39279.1 outer membrane biogenesis protein BamB [Stratiformator vulcanicus]
MSPTGTTHRRTHLDDRLVALGDVIERSKSGSAAFDLLFPARVIHMKLVESSQTRSARSLFGAAAVQISRRSLTKGFAILILLTSSMVTAADWDHWRGPNRNGLTSETSGWDGGSWIEEQIWSAQVGAGSSSPLIVGDCVYLQGWSGNRDAIVCLDATSGKERWRQSYPQPRYGRHAVGDQSLYSGSSPTPEYDAETKFLFTLGVDGDLNAWDTRDGGKNVWSLNLYDHYHAGRRPEVAKRRRTRRDYGYTGAPLAHGDQLIVEVGGDQGNVVAFDKRTGRQLWTSKNQDEAGHTAGPVLLKVGRMQCVAVLTLRNLVVTQIDGKTPGRTIAIYPWTTDFGNNVASPAVHENSVVITSAYNQSAMCRLDITTRGAREVWKTEGLASGVCSPIIHDGRIYWAWNGVRCVDFETGSEIWRGGKVGSQGSCILTGDDRLIVYANRGDLLLAETAKRSPDEYLQLAAKKVLSKTDAWPHVAFSSGQLVCRDRAGNVRCLKVSPR